MRSATKQRSNRVHAAESICGLMCAVVGLAMLITSGCATTPAPKPTLARAPTAEQTAAATSKPKPGPAPQPASKPTAEQLADFSFKVTSIRTTREPQRFLQYIGIPLSIGPDGSLTTSGEPASTFSAHNRKPAAGHVFVILHAALDFPMRTLDVAYDEDLYLLTTEGIKCNCYKWTDTKKGELFMPGAGASTTWKRDSIRGKDMKFLFNVPEDQVAGSVIQFYGKTIPLAAE